MRKLVRGVALLATLTVSACAPTYRSTIQFPDPTAMFLTTGDGDIQKPYTPVGQLLYIKQGFRLPLPILGLIPIADVDPDAQLREGILEEVRRMGGDAVINLRMDWTPPKNGFLGFGAEGGSIAIYGTVIRR